MSERERRPISNPHLLYCRKPLENAPQSIKTNVPNQIAMDSTNPDRNLVDLLNNMDKETINPLQLTQIINDYYDTTSMSGQSKMLNKTKLKIIHLNIHSLPDKFDKLKLLLFSTKLDVDIILLCETFLTESNEHLYQLNGYQLICKSRKNKSQGVAMYIKNEINFKLIYYNRNH